MKNAVNLHWDYGPNFRSKTACERDFHIPNKKPSALFVRKTAKVDKKPSHFPIVEEQEDGWIVAMDYYPLYQEHETRPMRGRTYQCQRLANIFYPEARKDSYVIEGPTGYSTQGYYGLSVKHFRAHWNNPEKTLHVKATEKTRWCCIDLDCHEKDDPQGFLRSFDSLLDVCHGDGWHYQINHPHITGCQFIKIFDSPQSLKYAHNLLNDILQEGGLPQTEIYPQGNHSCRLPGDPNRLRCPGFDGHSNCLILSVRIERRRSVSCRGRRAVRSDESTVPS